MSTILERLSRRFKVEDVYTRTERGKTFHYISAERTIDRFNEVLPLAYSWRVDESTYERWPVDTQTSKPQWAARCRGHISLVYPYVERGGVGGGVNADLDMVLKTAQAEAFKKAGHQFGVGLYLWDERERDLVDYVKAEDWRKAASQLCRIDFAGDKVEMLAHFGTTDPQEIITKAGLL